MPTNDPYSLAHNIAQKLRAEGLQDWSERTEDAIASGSTATEILMALRWNLTKLLAAGVHLSGDVKESVAQLIQQINALGI